MPAIPVTVVGGYLGAGKTTLVNHLLRSAAGERIAVLVNDFGDIGIDAGLIESREDGVIELAGGCVCCSFGSDLMAALMRLPAMDPPPARAIVETSGVALPRPVARSVGLARGLVADAVVVLADAQALLDRAADRYVGDTVVAQLREADLILLNKVDLIDGDLRRRLHAWLGENAPQAVVVDAERGEVAPALLFGPSTARRAAGTLGGGATAGRGLAPPAAHRAASAFESLGWRFAGAVDAAALADVLCRPELGVARAKGLVIGNDARAWLVQVVGRRAEVVVQPGVAPDAIGRLACIGARGRFERGALAAALAEFGPGSEAGQGD